MPNKPNFSDLYQLAGEIRGETKGINSRLDKINGRLDDHGKKIDDLEDSTATMKGQQKGVAAVWGFLGGAVGVVIAILTFFRRQ